MTLRQAQGDTVLVKLDALGAHRVIDPPGAMPQNARRIDNTPVAHENEILCDVEVLNIDSASFKQIRDCCGGDAGRIAEHIMQIVRDRGKQHNPVTGSGGMFIGRVLKIGERLRHNVALRAGDRIASLVSLTLTPLYIESIIEVDVETGRVWIRGKAVLFESGLWARLPADIHDDVALAAFDVAGAPAQVQRMTRRGMTVAIVGADGKSGMLACAQAKLHAGAEGRVIGIAPDASTPAAQLLQGSGFVDAFVEADARNALEVASKLSAVAPDLADLVVNCVNVPGTELASILCTKQHGTVYFFSMATSFTAAALGAEGVGKDVTMIIGNGYAVGHAECALQTLRDHPEIHRYFTTKYVGSR
jgi:L-erythro-3,5-diaminohexanoate dehydrogenase